jgi:Rieske Fe-S protein
VSSRRFTRRSFVKLCAGTAAMVAADPRMLAPRAAAAEPYPAARLVDRQGADIGAGELAVGEAYLFHYPYVSTPCFLLDLGEPLAPVELETERGAPYTWPGGVGPRRSIVAFSAICSHRMTHPAGAVSFINYRDETVRYLDKTEQPRTGERVIYCCSEKSVFDPARGARVLGGPAPQPLATVLLDYDPDSGALWATGTAGAALFEPFFEKFGFRLMLSHGKGFRDPVGESTRTERLADYTDNQVFCG